jgi:hypothetical protein
MNCKSNGHLTITFATQLKFLLLILFFTQSLFASVNNDANIYNKNMSTNAHLSVQDNFKKNSLITIVNLEEDESEEDDNLKGEVKSKFNTPCCFSKSLNNTQNIYIKQCLLYNKNEILNWKHHQFQIPIFIAFSNFRI